LLIAGLNFYGYTPTCTTAEACCGAFFCISTNRIFHTYPFQPETIPSGNKKYFFLAKAFSYRYGSQDKFNEINF